MLSFPRHRCRFVPLVVAAAAFACGGESLVVPPTTGTLRVTTATSGAEPDADGYVVQVDGGAEQAIGASASLQNAEVGLGTHTVQLAGVAPNCTVAGENPRTVSITAGETGTVAFEVTCVATTGSLQISASTSGPTPDPDGYNVTVDGTDRGVLAPAGNLTVDGLAPGDHVVGLSGVAGNCQVLGDNPRAVGVTVGSGATVAFAITCTPPPANVGSIRITTATTGTDQDPNGYAFAVDGPATQSIGLNTSAVVTSIAVGAHSVVLSGVAPNCTVGGGNTHAVDVSAGTTADVSFAISCSATTGTIRVSVATSGSPTDPDGYTVKLDGAAPGRPIGTNQSLEFPGVPAGNHSVALSGLAANCSITGGPSQNVNVTVGGTAQVSFAVTCAATTGSIKVTTATTGSNPDNGYSVSVDGGTAQPIGANTSIILNGVPAGSRSVAISGVAANCTVGGGNTRQVTVTAGQTANAEFSITCAAAVQARIAFVSDNPGVRDVFTVNPDGTERRRLTDGLAGFAETPQWSPDRSKIVFEGGPVGGEIYVINADGSGLTNLTKTPSGTVNETAPEWSPNGSRILFTKTTIVPSDLGDQETTDLYTMNADGSNPVQLTTTGTESRSGGYDWSPNGLSIAFASERNGQPLSIYVMRAADGADVSRLTESGVSYAPAWSPNENRIAFLRDQGGIEVWAMNSDGADETQLTNQAGDHKTGPAWSPDGSKILYMFASSVSSSDIWTVNADGNGEFNVTASGGDNTSPVWSPDGAQIAFVFGFGSGTPVVRVINADGTGLRMNVSDRPAASFRPDW